MDTANARKILSQKEPSNLYDVVGPVLKDAELRDLLVKGSFAKDETYRYNCVRVLNKALAQQPSLFYSYWNEFENMIDSPNSFHRSIAAQAIAYLSTVDVDCRLDRILKYYLKLLDDEKVMATHYFLETITVVYRARPDFQKEIVATLLSVDKTKHPPSRKDLVKADIVNIFDQLFDILSLKDQKKVRAFVEAQLESSSPKTRKAAKEFRKKHP